MTDSNLAENVDAGSSTENGAAPAGAGPATEAVNSSHANVDAAVNMLKEAEADQNEYCDAQQEATGESDCNGARMRRRWGVEILPFTCG